jgi:hypothetical protein
VRCSSALRRLSAPFSPAADHPPPSDGRGLPPHATPPSRRLPRLVRSRARCGSAPANHGEDAPHRLLQPTRVHVHLLRLDRATPEAPSRTACAARRRRAPSRKPRRRARVGGRLTTLHRASRGPRPSRRPVRERAFASSPGSAGAVRSWGGFDRIPSGGAPGRAALSSARREDAPLSDALTTTARAEARRPPPEDLSRGTSSKVTHRMPSGRLPSTNARSARRFRAAPRTRTRHPRAGFAAVPGLPTLLRPLALFRGQWARPRRYRGLFTRGRSWPRAVRRLLPSKRSASTTVEPSIPGAAPSEHQLSPARGVVVGPRLSPPTTLA